MNTNFITSIADKLDFDVDGAFEAGIESLCTSVYSDMTQMVYSFGVWNTILTLVVAAIIWKLWRMSYTIRALAWRIYVLDNDIDVAFEALGLTMEALHEGKLVNREKVADADGGGYMYSVRRAAKSKKGGK